MELPREKSNSGSPGRKDAEQPRLIYKYSTKKPEPKCKLVNCDLCINGSTLLLNYEMRKHGWRRRLVVAFNTVTKSKRETWLSLTKDIYPFFDCHWRIFWPNITQESYPNWKKKVQDSLSHGKDVFVSGATVFGRKGYWRLTERSKTVVLPLQPPNKEEMSAMVVNSVNLNSSVQQDMESFLTQKSELLLPSNIQDDQLWNSSQEGATIDSCLAKEFQFFLDRNGIIPNRVLDKEEF